MFWGMNTVEMGRLFEHFDVESSRRAWREEREGKRKASGIQISDHMPRIPREGLPMPELEPDPGLGRRGGRFLVRQFNALVEATPPVVTATNPLVGGYAWMMTDYYVGQIWANEALTADPDYEDIHNGTGYAWVGIGMPGHLVPDLSMGLKEGWGGLARRVQQASARGGSEAQQEYWANLKSVIATAQNFIARHADVAEEKARENSGNQKVYEELASQIRPLIEAPPETTWQACLWLGFFMCLNRIYSGQNTLGAIDTLLAPIVRRDMEEGRLSEEELEFLLEALLFQDTHFIGMSANGEPGSVENRINAALLRAWNHSRGPANLGIHLRADTDPGLYHLAVKTLVRGKQGVPVLLNDDALKGGMRNRGIPEEKVKEYIYGGCQWMGIPGQEYSLNDGTKLITPAIFYEALAQVAVSPDPSCELLWETFAAGLEKHVKLAARAYTFQRLKTGALWPELLQSLFCHGPVEKGCDVLAGGVEHTIFLLDAMGVANVVDSFCALEQVAGKPEGASWQEILKALEANFEGFEPLRKKLLKAPKYGSGHPDVRRVAGRMRDLLVECCRRAEPADGIFKIQGNFYSWNGHNYSKWVSALPDGRRQGEPLSHGANPSPGMARRGPTALGQAVAMVQCGGGSSAPVHLELDARSFASEEALESFEAFVRTFFEQGGTQIVANFMSRDTLESAIRTPAAHTDLTLRVTGFSAYFVNLDPGLYPEILSRYE